MINKIKVFIFGQSVPVDSFSPGTTTTIPNNMPSFNEWCKEYNVSILYKRY